MKKLLPLIVALLLAIIAMPVLAAPPTEVRAIGTYNGVTYTIYQGYGEPTPINCEPNYNRYYEASNGTKGCWVPDNTYNRYVIIQKTPVNKPMFFVPYSAFVNCPTGTTDPNACLQQ